MSTTVANIYHLPRDWQDDPKYVYIGRPGKGLDGTFGNPYRLVDGAGRAAALTRYTRWLSGRLMSDIEFRDKVEGLSGKVLVCFCKPKACHGDILATAADALVYHGWQLEAAIAFGDVLEHPPVSGPADLPEIEWPDE